MVAEVKETVKEFRHGWRNGQRVNIIGIIITALLTVTIGVSAAYVKEARDTLNDRFDRMEATIIRTESCIQARIDRLEDKHNQRITRLEEWVHHGQ